MTNNGPSGSSKYTLFARPQCGECGIEPDTFNVVTFKPVRTKALRLDVQCQDEKGRWAMGIHEWRIR
jgi:hypothetical protein